MFEQAAEGGGLKLDSGLVVDGVGHGCLLTRGCRNSRFQRSASRPRPAAPQPCPSRYLARRGRLATRSEEHTSELQSLMRISYAVFCLKKKKKKQTQDHD